VLTKKNLHYKVYAERLKPLGGGQLELLQRRYRQAGADPIEEQPKGEVHRGHRGDDGLRGFMLLAGSGKIIF